jgi:hypothetical protein
MPYRSEAPHLTDSKLHLRSRFVYRAGQAACFTWLPELGVLK